MHIRGVKMRKLREEEQLGSWRGPEQQDAAGGKKKYIAERKKKQEGNKKSQAGKKNCEWKCMFYYPLILKIIIFPRITFINLFRNLTNTTEVSQHSCEQTARGSELEHSYQPYAITRLVTANTVEKSLYGERNDSR